MVTRAVVVWLLILVLAVLNGALREGLLVPQIGARAGHVVSTILLAAVVLIISWALVPWIRPAAAREAWFVGGLWLALTVGFEFLAGHYAFGKPWDELLADYDVAHGRIWVLVPIATLLAPVLVHVLGRGR